MSATRASSARGATRQAESGAALVVTVRSAHGLRPTRCTRKHGVFLWLAHGASAQAATEVTDHDLYAVWVARWCVCCGFDVCVG